MDSSQTSDAAVQRSQRLAELEGQRARGAALRAAHSEAQAQSANSSSLASVHASAAAMHRDMEGRHRLAARLHRAHAHRLQRWARSRASSDRPGFLSAVAATVNSRGATLALHGATHADALVAASDARARRAHDLEVTLAEGPAYQATDPLTPVVATATELPARWPRYGPAVRELGVHTVAAVALRAGQRTLGSLTVYDPPPPVRHKPAALTALSHALVHGVLLADEAITTDGELATVAPWEPEDIQPELHQAAGKIAAATPCSIDSALAMIRAHAFAETRSVTDVAHEILNNQFTLP